MKANIIFDPRQDPKNGFRGYTGQYYTSRNINSFENKDGEWVVDCAAEFVKLANNQITMEEAIGNCELNAHWVYLERSNACDASIDLDEWPSHIGFNDWFEKWANKWNIEIQD
tara:strand:- start:8674 stop:9012 length:339 start_codon:yes stop_codon:yes gene_type:complete